MNSDTCTLFLCGDLVYKERKRSLDMEMSVGRLEGQLEDMVRDQ